MNTLPAGSAHAAAGHHASGGADRPEPAVPHMIRNAVIVIAAALIALAAADPALARPIVFAANDRGDVFRIRDADGSGDALALHERNAIAALPRAVHGLDISASHDLLAATDRGVYRLSNAVGANQPIASTDAALIPLTGVVDVTSATPRTAYALTRRGSVYRIDWQAESLNRALVAVTADHAPGIDSMPASTDAPPALLVATANPSGVMRRFDLSDPPDGDHFDPGETASIGGQAAQHPAGVSVAPHGTAAAIADADAGSVHQLISTASPLAPGRVILTGLQNPLDLDYAPNGDLFIADHTAETLIRYNTTDSGVYASLPAITAVAAIPEPATLIIFTLLFITLRPRHATSRVGCVDSARR